MTFWKKKYQNLLKISEIFAIFENSNVDTVAAWFDRPNISRPNNRLSAKYITQKNVLTEDLLVKKKLEKHTP